MRNIYCTFPQGKTKALTFSYDDGNISDRRLVEIFNRNGLKGTFHLNNSFLYGGEDKVQQNEITTLYAGHEVACHTAHHPTIERCPLTEVVEEMMENRRELEKVVGYPVVGFSYPNRSYSPEIITMLPGLGIKYAREGETTYNFFLPKDLYHWKGTCHHDEGLIELGKEFSEINKPAYLRLMYVWGHSWQFDRNNNWNVIEDFCDMIGGHDDIWYCTNIEYVSVMDNFKRLEFAADNSFVYNPNAVSCWIAVDGEICEALPGQITWF